MPDYDCYPTWVHDGADDAIFENVAPEDLPIGRALADELDRWGEEYDATLDRDDPAASGFESPEAEADFAHRGELLARRLREELGGLVPVEYFDVRTSRHVPMA
jgi:hypothetical protein